MDMVSHNARDTGGIVSNQLITQEMLNKATITEKAWMEHHASHNVREMKIKLQTVDAHYLHCQNCKCIFLKEIKPK